MCRLPEKCLFTHPEAIWDFFYKDHGTAPDNNLIPLGEVESGLEYLATQKNGFTVRIEVLN
ncbi:MAG: hypothetical protein J6L82_03505 [Alphaproteobacteria bacterium]|nr:hypothetical protein [Alphaproteobacteria bacterium]